MSRYIDYDAIDYRNGKMHDKSSDFIDGVIYMAQRIEDAPSIDIEPKRGEWITVFDDRHRLLKVLKCNLCGAKNHFFVEDERNFCPNCGADMRKESE